MPRFHRGYALAAIVLIPLTYGVSLWLFPEWRLSTRGLLVLAVAAVVGVVAFLDALKNVITAPGPSRPPPPAETHSSESSQPAGPSQPVPPSGVQTATGSYIGQVMGSGSVEINVTQVQSPPPSFLHQLPPPPADFTGREAELDQLLPKFEQGGVLISGLYGMGGLGKTALALKLAERLTTRYPDAQLFLDLKGTSDAPMSFADAWAHVIRAFHPTERLPESEPDLRGLYHSVLHDKRALLVLDNARDAEQVKPLLPPPTCAVIITSRWHFVLPGLYAKDLEALPPSDAEALLLRIAPRIDGHVGELARQCSYLPLALRVSASALAERIDLTPTVYLRRLSDSAQRLRFTGVEASLQLSYDLLTAELQARWRALAVFPDIFDRFAAEDVWQLASDPAQEALSELLRFSLIQYFSELDCYLLHDLARLFADARLPDAERLTAHLRHAKYYTFVLRTCDKLYLKGGDDLLLGLTLFDLEWTNIRAGQAWAAEHAGTDDSAARLASDYPDVGDYCLSLRRHPREQIRWREAALAAARRLRDRTAEGRHLGNLGLAYADLDDARRAIEFFEQALAIARELGDRLGEGYALGNLGLAYADLDDARRAIEFYEQALPIFREPGERQNEVEVHESLGHIFFDLREFQSALNHYTQALAISEENGDRHTSGRLLRNIGSTNLLLGNPQFAIEFSQKGLAIARELGYPLGEAIALAIIGEAHAARNAPRQAIEFYEKALPIFRDAGTRDREAETLWNKSLALDKLGSRSEAIAHAEAALSIYQQLEHNDATKVRDHLAKWREEPRPAGHVSLT